MSDEYFDVVNDRDEPVGRERRSEVHARGLRHRAVLIFVFNAAGQVFLQKRSMRKDVSPGLWTVSCSGHVDAGEDYDAAAKRELGEELGLHRAEPPSRWFRVEACAETDWEFSWIYRTRSEGPFVLHPEEIESGEWATPEEINRRLRERPGEFCPGFRWIWSLLARHVEGRAVAGHTPA
ncbi:MAG: hydrolase [Verrucomicrobia bacterium]|nr:hydrolase [Verrucomicrobiota bacterium]